MTGTDTDTLRPDITLRALTTVDVPAWNRLLAATEEVDRTGEHYNEADLLEELANPDIEVGKDVLGAFAGDRLVGFYLVYPRSSTDGYHKVILVGAVHPELRGQGLGTRLAGAMHRRALEAHRERHPDLPLLLTLRGPAGDRGQRDLMAGIGLTPSGGASRCGPTLPASRAPGAPCPRTCSFTAGRGSWTRRCARLTTPRSSTTRTSRRGARRCGASGSARAAASGRS
jgi:GNAT superfamily N-acetyltransferase